MLARPMEELGYYCMWSQCSVKIKNLVSKYRKVQDGNNTTGNNRQDFVLYDAQPDTIISSSTSRTMASMFICKAYTSV